MKQNRNKSKSWKIEEIKYRLNITCWNCNRKDHLQNQCSKLVASRDKEVNQAARDSDDRLVCYVENTVEDRIMDSGASFHATYCKKELERFNLCSSKVHLADDNALGIAGIKNVVLKTSFGTNVEACIWLRIGMSMLASKGNVPDVRKKAVTLHLLHQSKDPATMILLSKTVSGVAVEQIVMLKMVPKTPLQFGVAERLSQIFRAESMGLGLRIQEEDWRGKDTSLTHLKVFCYDSFVKVKDVCGESMKCTFIGSDLDEVRYIFRDTKSHQVIRSRDITFVDSIYEARWRILQGGRFRDSTGTNIHQRVQGSGKVLSISKLFATDRERLWMFKVKEEQNSSERYKAPLSIVAPGAFLCGSLE
nr:retrovirus-related Pol polyprotein from transposon TNT 1-94 [Tanacetum cinerariifolium]